MKAMNRTLVSPYFRPHPCASFFIVPELHNFRIEALSECAAGHLLYSKTVSDNTRPSQDQEEASSAEFEERFKLVPTAELVDAPKSGRYDGISRSPRLDLEASPLGVEIPSDGPCPLGDTFNMTESTDLWPVSSTSLNPAEIVPTEDASRVVEKGLPVRPPPVSSTSDSLAPIWTYLKLIRHLEYHSTLQRNNPNKKREKMFQLP